MKSFLVQNSVVKRLYECSSCYPQNLNAQVEMKKQNLGKADQLVWQASCTCSPHFMEEKIFVFDFYWNPWLQKSHFFSLKKGTTVLPITSSLTCANYWQHPLQMSYVLGAFSCSPKPCNSINQFILCVGPCLISTKNTASDRAKNLQPD